ncbi:hypothetical protein [Polaromonas sp.]|uniref:hypothetical protein n=1 Tax=Polaromonas sp. TaxID=1869339 RepID=UPI003561F074
MTPIRPFPRLRSAAAIALGLLALAVAGCAMQAPYDVVEQGEQRTLTVHTAANAADFTHCLQMQLLRVPYPSLLPGGISTSVPAVRRISLKDGFELRGMSAHAHFVAHVQPRAGAIDLTIFSNGWPGVPPYGTLLQSFAQGCAAAAAPRPPGRTRKGLKP